MKKRILAVAIQCLAFVVVYYLGSIAAYARHIQTPWLVTAIDYNIPLLPLFVWPYISAYFLDSAGIYFSTQHLSNQKFRAVLLACYINLALFFLCHVSMPRMALKPTIHPHDISTFTLMLVQHLTTRYNTFPSAHVSYSLITTWAAVMSYHKNKLLSCLLIADAASIIASTLFIKEHAAIDVLGGAGVALISVVLAIVLSKKPQATD